MTTPHPPENPRRPLVVVAMDAFKGTLSAAEACAAAARGVRRAWPGARVRLVPLADGGEGTAEALIQAGNGSWIPCTAPGPLPDRDVPGMIGWLAEAGPDAVVEMARVNGLTLLEPNERNPELTSTRGTGVLLDRAVARGARTLWLAIGGSATVDGGTGAARALGWRFLDRAGGVVPEGGGALRRIHRILPPADDPLRSVRVRVLCDVDNPLLGPRGAARVFGPQKGATPDQVERLESGLAHLASRIEVDLGQEVRTLPGGGAAGGLGAGALAFMHAELLPGIDAVMEAVGLERILGDADLVITGEGSFDESSLHGKVVSGVARRAGTYGIPVAVVAGRVEVSPDQAREAGVFATEAAVRGHVSVDEAMSRAGELLAEAAERLARRVGRP